MAIAYQDFVSNFVERRFLVKKYEGLPVILARANEWIEKNHIRVLNVETIFSNSVLEIIRLRTELIRIEAKLKVSKVPWIKSYVMNDSVTNYFQVVRVWYEKTEETAQA